MLYLSERVLGLEESFIENCFTKRGDLYYFVIESHDKGIFLCIKLWNKFDERRFELEVVRVYLTDDDIIEDIVKDKKDREVAVQEFFYHLSYYDNPQSVIFFEGIKEFIKEYIVDAYFYAEECDSIFKNSLHGDFMELFKIKGLVAFGYYGGNVVLRDICLFNESTNQEIVSFENVNLCSNLYLEENDDEDYVIEAYLESMSELDIQEKFMEVINRDK